jgi:hypothetical protein
MRTVTYPAYIAINISRSPKFPPSFSYTPHLSNGNIDVGEGWKVVHLTTPDSKDTSESIGSEGHTCL